ncbi:MAG: hypothetical protein A3H32_11895 [Betaproteobacteria bacterium RIFCSPLOWO2_02_FULL_63_19]|nr:MAG: hypothetical protein A3H32_11895 [Betaproteobacteria bacterium RIFCSPLOWO2_02_FULL_63_19]
MSSQSTDAAAAEESRQYPYWRRNLQVLPVANLLCSLGFAISWPFLPLMVRGLGVHENLATWVGYMMLGFYVIGFIMNPIWGSVADHFGRKLMVLRAMLGMGFFMALVPFATTPIWFAGLFMLVGFFNGYTPAGISLLAANTPPNRLGTAFSLALTGSLIGQTLGPAVGAALAALISRQHWLFWISGALLMMGGALVALLMGEVRQPAPGPWRPRWMGSLRELLVVPSMGPLFLLSFVFAALWAGNVPVVTLYMLQLIADQPESFNEAYWVGAAAMGLAVSSVVALPLWGKVMDRFGPAPVLVFATGAAAVTHVLLIVLQSPLQLVLARVAFGFTAAAMQPAYMQLIKLHAPRGMDARAIAYASAFQFIAMGSAAFFAGIIGPALGLRMYFALIVAVTLVSLMLWIGTQRREAARGAVRD